MTDKIAAIINTELARLDREARERHIITAAALEGLLAEAAQAVAGDSSAPAFRRYQDICHILRSLAERDGQISSIGFDLPPGPEAVNAMAWLEIGLLATLDGDKLASWRDIFAKSDAVYITNKGRHTRYTFSVHNAWPPAGK